MVINNQEDFSLITFKVSSNDGVDFTNTTEAQEDLADGKYVYKTLVTDLAGNSSETATVSVTIETVPKLNVIKLTNNTDTGKEGDADDPLFNDKLRNLTEILVSSIDPSDDTLKEAGLRIFVQKSTGNFDMNNLDLFEDLSGAYSFSDDGSSGDYAITFSQDLNDGKYAIIAEDDAGNRSTVSETHTFVVDRTPPPLSEIKLIDGTDRGVSTTDRYTAEKLPVIQFTSEPGLRIAFNHTVGDTTTEINTDKFVLGRVDPIYSIEPVYSVADDGTTVTAISFAVVNQSGQDLTQQEIIDLGLNLSIAGLNTATNLFDRSITDSDGDGKYSIVLPEGLGGTAELDDIPSLQVNISSNNSVLISREFSSTPGRYEIQTELAVDQRTINTKVIDTFTRAEVSDLESANLQLSIQKSADGTNWTSVTQNGNNLELDDEFAGATDVKVELLDISNADLPISLTLEEFNKSSFSGYGDDYIVSFVDNLDDGVYAIKIKDDAGNEVIGQDDLNQTFTVDGSAPVFPSTLRLDSYGIQFLKDDGSGKLVADGPIRLISSEEKDEFDLYIKSNDITSTTNFTASIPDNIITITQAIIDDLSNESFVTNGLEVGSYVLVGQNIQDLKLRTLNMSDLSNIVATQDPDILLSDIFTNEATWQQFLTDNSLTTMAFTSLAH